MNGIPRGSRPSLIQLVYYLFIIIYLDEGIDCTFSKAADDTNWASG